MDVAFVPPAEVAALEPLYAERTTLRAVVDSVLQGSLGSALSDSRASPRVARLDVGCYAIFGGDAAAARARELVRSVAPPRELLFPDANGWRGLLREMHTTAIVERPMRSFVGDALDPVYLRHLAGEVPAGCAVERIDADLASRLGPVLQPHAMQVFPTAEDFARRGIGYCALVRDTIACAATSYTVASGCIELAIATHPDFRRRGLARTVAARLMAHCLEHGIVPHWNAGNPVSQHLAATLGYRPAGLVEILWLPPEKALTDGH